MHESPEERRERHEREAEEKARHSAASTYTINVNVHYATDPVPAWARTMTTQLEKLMAVSQQTADAIAKVDAETNALADRVAKIQATLADASQTAEDKAAALNELGLLADRLKTIGADPSNPVPPAP